MSAFEIPKKSINLVPKRKASKEDEIKRKEKLLEKKLTGLIAEAKSPADLKARLENNILSKVIRVDDAIQSLVDPRGIASIKYVPDIFGLREKAIEFIKKEISETNSMDDLRRFIKKLDNLKQEEINELIKKVNLSEEGEYSSQEEMNNDEYGIVKKANEIAHGHMQEAA